MPPRRLPEQFFFRRTVLLHPALRLAPVQSRQTVGVSAAAAGTATRAIHAESLNVPLRETYGEHTQNHARISAGGGDFCPDTGPGAAARSA